MEANRTPQTNPPASTVVLNALGRLRDLFSFSLMHRFNGALTLLRAPEGLLRLVMRASSGFPPAVRSLSSEKRFACKQIGCVSTVIAGIVCFA